MGKFLEEKQEKVQKRNTMLDKSLERLNLNPIRTPQAIFAEICHAWENELNERLLPPEDRKRMNNLLTSDHRNYSYFRMEFKFLIDYALRKKIIK